MKKFIVLFFLLSLSASAQSVCEDNEKAKQAIVKMFVAHGFPRGVIDVTDEYMKAGKHQVYFKELDVVYVRTKNELVRKVYWLHVIDTYENVLNFESGEKETMYEARDAIRCLSGQSHGKQAK